MCPIKFNMITDLNVNEGLVFDNQNARRCLESNSCFTMRQLSLTQEPLDSQSYYNSLIGVTIYE